MKEDTKEALHRLKGEAYDFIEEEAEYLASSLTVGPFDERRKINFFMNAEMAINEAKAKLERFEHGLKAAKQIEFGEP